MNNLNVSISPHFIKEESTAKIMWSVFFALVPAGIVGVAVFGLSALNIIITCVLTAVITEAALQALMRKKITVADGSAALTGLLLAYNLSASVPLWLAALGSIFAIAIVKQAFGGLGKNIFNPALAARAFLLVSWPKYMTSFPAPFSYDAVSAATPLTIVKENMAVNLPSNIELFLGMRGGCIGEVCAWALILGGLYLLYKRYITYHTPLGFIGGFALLTWAFGAKELFKADILFQLMSGGLLLGAFFMATDYVTSPLTRKGQFVFGLGCGLLTFVIRKWGGYPEGVSYSILLMNAATPIIDRFVRPRRYGSRSRIFTNLFRINTNKL